MQRYICIHGHFYQPPRENPWLESIEVQDTAYPYHDWNERILAECYATNAAARILDEQGRIVKIANNYAKISFNFGPTLLAWMKEKAPLEYQAVLAADRESQSTFSGHGSAIAQAYNHMILPLANGRDKSTQIRWGIEDFKSRFRRAPEGMWLAETAVDTESLELLAENGIRFTILAPHQARRVRKLGDKDWHDVRGGRVDPTMPYEIRLPSGRSIAVYFYDGPISQGVAFEKLLTRGENLAHRLLGAFSSARHHPQLVHIATDGETYGHHHRHGEMALAYALDTIENSGAAHITNYGEFLALHPPAYEAQIVESSAWSCAHGVERWRGDCGCNTGSNPRWNQQWRKPLRDALDWLRDSITIDFERDASKWLHDPWAARDDYVHVILDRSPASLVAFFAKHAIGTLSDEEKVATLKLMELQRHAMLMYTSCGWFFDDISGIETIQVIRYACRVIQLAWELFEKDLEGPFLNLLGGARSNIPAFQDGKVIYELHAKPAMTDLSNVVAHYALTSLFREYAPIARVYCYEIAKLHYLLTTAGKAKLAFGQVRITSLLTQESGLFSFGVLHLGDHNLIGGVRPYRGETAYQDMHKDMSASFSRADFPETMRRLEKQFGPLIYSLRSLFHDEQRKILGLVLDSTLHEVEGVYRQIQEHHAPLMRYLSDLKIPLPKALQTADEFILNTDVKKAFEEPQIDFGRIRKLLEEASSRNVELDEIALGFVLPATLERVAEQFRLLPTEGHLEEFQGLVGMIRSFGFEVNLWRAQNIFYAMLQTAFPAQMEKAEGRDAQAARWVREFRRLGELLTFRVDDSNRRRAAS